MNGQVSTLAESPLGRNMTFSERLFQQKKQLEERLQIVNEAIKAMEETPGIQNALDAISKVGLY